MHQFDFGWGSAPDPAGGAYSAPPDPLAGFKGPTSKGRGRVGRTEKSMGGAPVGAGGHDPPLLEAKETGSIIWG